MKGGSDVELTLPQKKTSLKSPVSMTLINFFQEDELNGKKLFDFVSVFSCKKRTTAPPLLARISCLVICSATSGDAKILSLGMGTQYLGGV